MTTPKSQETEVLRGIVLMEFADYITPGMALLGDYLDMFFQTLPYHKYQRILAMLGTATPGQAKKYARIYVLQEMLNLRFQRLYSEHAMKIGAPNSSEGSMHGSP